ncbi:hypothetical protein [Sphingomonas sp. VNH70]|uniref:hypothetical protein n=1 Tax=Sphingomonas silueang TaxID=3156617 RepID=UPI0032B33A56
MRFAAFAIPLMLSACAANELRIERANSLSAQAKVTVAAGRTYITDLQARRREAALALIASDPSCLWVPTLTVDAEWDGSRGLCDLTGVPATRQETINLQPISPEGLKAMTTAIAGIAAYQGSLADILEEEPENARESIGTAIETLATAAGDINRIAGDNVLDLGPLTSDRAAAVVALIGTLDAMRQTELKVRDVRALVARTDSTALIDVLDESATRLNRIQDGNAVVLRLQGLNRAYSDERSRLNFSERVERLRELAAANDDFVSGRRLRLETFRGVLIELRRSDAALRDALAGRFTAEERRRIARENRRQLFSILSQVAAIFPPL